jgi:hypothetical protein
VERFNPKNVSETEVRKEFQIEISNSFAALENLNNSEDRNRAWENIKEHIEISAKGRKVCMDGSIMTHGLMKNVYSLHVK